MKDHFIHSTITGLTAFLIAGTASADPASPDSSTILEGGSEGTVFEDMTIEGEDRIRIEFSRPALDLQIDAKNAPGLDWDHTLAVLERNSLSYSTPLIMDSRNERTPFLPSPWFRQFRSGPVARFTPRVEGVDRWQLTVADSRGQTVVTFDGDGKVPEEIAWDGMTSEGTNALPGLTYSYVFEAHDRAGNKRSFMGEPFELPPYRRHGDEGGVVLLFSGHEVRETHQGFPAPILLEAAGWLNQQGDLDAPIEIEATARSYEEAKFLADSVSEEIASRILGSPARIRGTTKVLPDAPHSGTVTIRVSR
jgi:hypothetical protein